MIDELLAHCIEEIGFDGEAGTDIERLGGFIRDFHHQQTTEHGYPPQRVDDAYCHFVFRRLLEDDNVVVGIHVPGDPSAKPSKVSTPVRGSKMLKKEEPDSATVPFDHVRPLSDSKSRDAANLNELRAQHGDSLRLALTSEAVKNLLLGNDEHALSAANYRFLQLVCRSRQHAAKSVDLGAAMGCDQKTVFYLAKKLIDSGLIAKLKARETGTSASYFVAAKFLDSCPLVIEQRNADIDPTNRDMLQAPVASSSRESLDDTVNLTRSAVSLTGGEAVDSKDSGDEDAYDHEDEEDNGDDADAPAVNIEEPDANGVLPQFHPVPLDRALVWISSRPELVRFRIYQLCDMTSSNITPRIGLVNRIRIQGGAAIKRQLTGLLEHAVLNGYLEVVSISISGSEASPNRTRRGLRMTAKGKQELRDLLEGTAVDPESQLRASAARKRNTHLAHDLSMRAPRLVREMTLERWTHEEVARSGTIGRTIRQLANAIHANGHFVRLLDGAIRRSDEAFTDSSLADLSIHSVHEHNLRMRSTRLFSHHAWVLQGANEGYLQEEDRAMLAAAGGPSAIHQLLQSWTDPKQLAAAIHSLADDLDSPVKPTNRPRIGRPPSSASKRKAERDPNTPVRRGRPPKRPKSTLTNTGAERGAAPAMNETGCAAFSAATQLEQQSSAVAPIHADPSASGFGSAPSVTSVDVAESPLPPDSTPCKSLGTTSEVLDTPAAAAADRRRGTKRPRPSSPSPSPGSSSIVAGEQAPHDEPTSSLAQEKVATPAIDTSRIADLVQTDSKEHTRSLPTTPAAKTELALLTPRSGSDRKLRTSLTRLRSVAALVECIRHAGGAIDTLLLPKELPAFLEEQGFASDVHIINLREKRIRDRALTAAVDDGLLRKTHVRVDRADVPHAQRQIIYLPEITPEQLQSYCTAVQKGDAGWISDKTAASTALTQVTGRVSIGFADALRLAHVKPWRVAEPISVEELSRDPDMVAMLRRHFAGVPSVYGQHVGYLGGAMVRLWAFHRACAQAITDGASQATSSPSATIPLSYFWTEAPLDLFLAFVPLVMPISSAEEAALNPELRAKPVRDTPGELRAAIHLDPVATDEVKLVFYSLAAQLSALGVAQLRETDPRPDAMLADGAVFVELAPHLPIYNWSALHDDKPLLEVIEAGLDGERIDKFWSQTRKACFRVYRSADGHLRDVITTRAAPPSNGGRSAENDFEEPDRDNARVVDPRLLDHVDILKKEPDELCTSLHAKKAWRTFNTLRPSQARFLARLRAAVSKQPLSAADLSRLAHACLAPEPAVSAFFHDSRARTEADSPAQNDEETTQPMPKARWPLRFSTVTLRFDDDDQNPRINKVVKKHKESKKAKAKGKSVKTIDRVQRSEKRTAEREIEGRRATLRKARELQERREQQFEHMLQDAFELYPTAETLRPNIEHALRSIRKRYVRGEIHFDSSKEVRKAVMRTVGSATGNRFKMPRLRQNGAGRKGARVTSSKTAAINGTSNVRNSLENDDDNDGDVNEADDVNGAERRQKRRSTRRSMVATKYWNPTRNELLRDAVVILRDRDHYRGRSDWSALLQLVEPDEQDKTRSSIVAQWRHQHNRLRYQYGEEGYLLALERKWTTIADAARVNGQLADPHFPSATEFDLMAHIEFLRSHIDKDELQNSLAKSPAKDPLPIRWNFETDFTRTWQDEIAVDSAERRFDAFFDTDSGTTSSRRLETLLTSAAALETSSMSASLHLDTRQSILHADSQTLPLRQAMAELAVRLIILSDSSAVDKMDTAETTPAAEHAATDLPIGADGPLKVAFCNAVGALDVEEATSRLLDGRIIRPISSETDSRRRPGTNIVFCEELLRAVPVMQPRTTEGLVDASTSADAQLGLSGSHAMLRGTLGAKRKQIEQSLGKPMLVEPIETDGDAAALITLMDARLINGDVDEQPFLTLRAHHLLNARVLNDDDLEALVTVTALDGVLDPIDATLSTQVPPMPVDRALDWSIHQPDGDMMLAWSEAFDQMVASQGSIDIGGLVTRFARLKHALLQAGPGGIPLDKLAYEIGYDDLEMLLSGLRPVVFLPTHSERACLVASAFIDHHSFAYVPPSASMPSAIMHSRDSRGRRHLLPRIWTTLRGSDAGIWRRLLSTLVELVVQRPGINLVALAARFAVPIPETQSSDESQRPTSRSFAAVGIADLYVAAQSLISAKILTFEAANNSIDPAFWSLQLRSGFIWSGFAITQDRS